MVTCLTLVEQELLTVPEHMSSSLVFSGDRVTRSLVVCFVDRYLSFCTFSFHYCVVCSSSTYGFWLSLWYLQGLLRSKHIWLFNVLQRTQMQSLFLFNTRFKFQNITIIFNYHSKVAVSRECNKRWRLHQNCYVIIKTNLENWLMTNDGCRMLTALWAVVEIMWIFRNDWTYVQFVNNYIWSLIVLLLFLFLPCNCLLHHFEDYAMTLDFAF